jgi:uncharacterized membrane protein (UPF0127 family)
MAISIGMILTGMNMRKESFEVQRKQVELVRNTPYATLSLEVADTPQALEKGLMYRTTLPPKTGMLFRFPGEAPRSFWMRNTLISLDMLFLKADGTIITIHENTQTQSDQNYPSTEPAQYGIELPAGSVRSLGIRLGDRVQGL